MKNNRRGSPGIPRVFLLVLVPIIREVTVAVFDAVLEKHGTIPALIITGVVFLLLHLKDLRKKREGIGTNGDGDVSAVNGLPSARAPQPVDGNKTDSTPGKVPGWVIPTSVILSMLLFYLTCAWVWENLSMLLLLPATFVLMRGDALYRLYLTHEDEEMLWGTAEDARVERRRSQLTLIRVCAAAEVYILSLLVAGGVSTLLPDPLRQKVAWFLVLSVCGAGTWGAVRMVRWPDPMTFLGRDILSARRYTVKSLYDTLKDTDTMFGSPGIARIRSHGRAVLYGPTSRGVYVFLVPHPLTKRISVRLMAAPSAVSSHREMPAYTVEIDERLNGYGPHMNFDAVLNEMTAEIDRILNGTEEGE